ncbi:MAG: hypothetical protein EXR07_14965 [Acetobacteraceae bacterium]|nr:hypothetical protein [Acetobacteraceae bacterium]
MLYIGEREICFDQSELGFPSILGCHAIVYVNANGLFGFHNYGGQTPDRWPGLSGAFGQFVNHHVNGGGAGTTLYGVCFATTHRSYGGIPRTSWLAELTAFANVVNFPGAIWGYDLAASGIPNSAYVSFFRFPILGTCLIQARPWVANEGTAGRNLNAANHVTTAPAAPIYNINQVANVTTAVGVTPLATYYPERLR